MLTLPEAQLLGKSKLSVTENGQAVANLKIASPGAKSAVVLAIDTSRSMHGKLQDALAAARAFADQRLPDQPLGIVYFSREPVVALEPTTDAAAIDKVLGEEPVRSSGTRVYDAAASGIEMIERADVAAGSVIVLSDGADYGSAISRNELVDAADRAHVRVFGVGLRSPSFDSTSLRSLSTNGGSYVEAAEPGDLAGIYSRLGDRQGREFLVSYRSRQPLESDIAVAFSVTGVDDVATAAYRAPDFPVPPALPDPPPTWWESGAATTFGGPGDRAVARARARDAVPPVARLGFAPHLAVHRGHLDLRRGGRDREGARVPGGCGRAPLEVASAGLTFELDVELSRFRWTPRQIVIVTASPPPWSRWLCSSAARRCWA